jgi:hypothetical protein
VLILMGQAAGTLPVASRDKDVESRLARQNRRFFRKPKANRSGAWGFTGFPEGCHQKSSKYRAKQSHAADFLASLEVSGIK